MTYHDPQPGGGPPDQHGGPPRFGFTVDDGAMPRYRLPRPRAVIFAMGLLPVLPLLGLATMVMWSVMRDDRAYGALLLTPYGVVGIGVLVLLEVLLWRGNPDGRIVTFTAIGFGLLVEVLSGRAGGSKLVRQVGELEPLYIAMFAVLVVAQLAVAAGLVLLLVRRDVTTWMKRQHRLRYEHKLARRYGRH